MGQLPYPFAIRHTIRTYSFLTRLRSFLFPEVVKSPTIESKTLEISQINVQVDDKKYYPELSFPILQQTTENKNFEVEQASVKPDAKILKIDSLQQSKPLSKPAKIKPRQLERPCNFKPTFLPKFPVYKSVTKEYLAQCTAKISSFRDAYNCRFEKNEKLIKNFGFSRSLLRNETRKLFKKRLIRGRPVFPPPSHFSLVTSKAVGDKLVAEKSKFLNNPDWWKNHIHTDAIDKHRRQEGPAVEKYDSIIGTLADKDSELTKASNGVPQFLSHLIAKKKHIEALSLLSSEFITLQNLDSKIQEAIDNPTRFNVPVEELLKEQYKASMIFKAVSDRVDEETGYSDEKLKDVLSCLQKEKENSVLAEYSFPSRS